MKPKDLRDRTLNFGVEIHHFIQSLPVNSSAKIISRQLLRSSMSVGANYRAARRSKSSRDFINKLKIVEEETDETLYWLQLLQRIKNGDPEKLQTLIQEADELTSIFVASINTAKTNLEKSKKQKP
jgi:four helix bundle protein